MTKSLPSRGIDENPCVPEGDFVVALDGPAASGKSSVARRIAEALDVPYVSSGLLYRAATYLALSENIPTEDAEAVVTLLGGREVRLEPGRRGDRVLADGADITRKLHTDAVDAQVSAVSRHPEVRRWVYRRLREIRGSFVVEGRDMGTVVFPEARFKFYLTAPAEVRAKRRVGERSASLAEVTEALKRRDLLDARQLVPASDARFVDTTSLNLEEVTQSVLRSICAHGEV
ncbi:MAG TPA: (d)CMP kinase [Trueperaceae bacterium]